MAIQMALTITQASKQKKIIFTDSDFSIKCLTIYKANWIRNGFKKADGSDV